MKTKYLKACRISRDVIGAAIEVHRHLGAGLMEGIYEKCLMRELEIRGYSAASQREVSIEYKGLVFQEVLRADLLVDDSLLLELKSVREIHPIHKAQLYSYMKLLGIPIGLLINFHEDRLTNGIKRMILPGASSNRSSAASVSSC